MFLAVFSKQAAADAKKLKAAGLDKKAKELVELVRQDPFARVPGYEALVGNLQGFYSRRINLQHRFVYQVLDEEVADENTTYEGVVKVVSMWSHYESLR